MADHEKDLTKVDCPPPIALPAGSYDLQELDKKLERTHAIKDEGKRVEAQQKVLVEANESPTYASMVREEPAVDEQGDAKGGAGEKEA